MDLIFPIHRRTGFLLMVLVSILLAAGSAALFVLADQAREGLVVFLELTTAILLLFILIIALYRIYVLINIQYHLTRDGLYLRWGLRRETIPLNNIEWVRPVHELGSHLPMPWLRLPGLIFGKRTIDGLGYVEYIATDSKNLILITTNQKVYAISPEDPKAFSGAFTRISEMGSLDRFQAESITPTLLLSNLWSDRIAKTLILVSFGLLLILFGVVSLSVSGKNSIVWTDGETVSTARLFLLPAFNTAIWVFDLIIGAIIYLREKVDHLAVYILWGFSSLTTILLMIATILIAR